MKAYEQTKYDSMSKKELAKLTKERSILLKKAMEENPGDIYSHLIKAYEETGWCFEHKIIEDGISMKLAYFDLKLLPKYFTFSAKNIEESIGYFVNENFEVPYIYQKGKDIKRDLLVLQVKIPTSKKEYLISVVQRKSGDLQIHSHQLKHNSFKSLEQVVRKVCRKTRTKITPEDLKNKWMKLSEKLTEKTERTDLQTLIESL